MSKDNSSHHQANKKPIFNVFKDTRTDAESTSPINRRQFMRGASVAAVGLSVGLAGCNDDNDAQSSALANESETKSKISFKHGVASGDPLEDKVILWTRVTPESKQTQLTVKWQLAEDEAFTKIVTQDAANTDASKDFTVKVDASGLTANTSYFYRFMVDDTVSTVGKTKTLPTGSVEQVRFAVFSCANYPAGFFNVYAEAAKRADFDVSVHLGDYIYEYARTKEVDGKTVPAYASANAAKLGREVLPETEILKEADYRQRYAQYRTDEDLQKLHAAAPMIAVWDDHEITNDAYKEGAENHQENEGSYDERKMTAMMVYHEWMPTRILSVNQLFRRFDFGNLLSLHMLDTRIYGRDKQLNYADYQTPTGLDAAKFQTDMADQSRQMLGATQEGWLQQQMQSSSATWQVLGQQVLMGRMNIPAPILLRTLNPNAGVSVSEYAAIAQKAQAAPETLTEAEKAVLAQPSIPYNLDAWDGYTPAREKVLLTAAALQKNLVVLAGDTHNAWANDLKDLQGNQVGVEFATSSVSSPGFEEYLPDEDPAVLSASITQLIPELQYFDSARRGYMHLTVSADACKTDWIFVDKIDTKDYTATVGKSMQVKSGADNRKLEES